MTQNELMNLMDKSDKTLLRCFELGVPVPIEWIAYRAEIRALITAGSGNAPIQPAYPEGT